jgi:hypothetical protein
MAGQPQYPVFIVSKGRAYNPLTANNFEKAGIDYLIAVEPQEAKEYEAKLGKQRVLVLPFANLGLGSYPARNYCWEYAKARGHKYHWIFDDNILHFVKWINGKRIPSDDKINEALKYVESFINKNRIDISGFEEPNFVVKPPARPFKINCHVYSAMIIKNDLPYRWRLKYNEDIDLCLQVLHGGGTTASCVYYMADKNSTVVKQKGGNQDELYKGNDPRKKLLKAKMIEAQWPQYAKTVVRFNRFHHLINWKQFKPTGKKLIPLQANGV